MAVCSIRSYEPEDARALWEAARESVADVFPWLPWCHAEYSLAEAVEWTRTRASLSAEGREYNFAILLRLEIVCAVGNQRSQRVAARAGALREGILRHRLLLHDQPVDAVVYSLVRAA